MKALLVVGLLLDIAFPVNDRVKRQPVERLLRHTKMSSGTQHGPPPSVRDSAKPSGATLRCASLQPWRCVPTT